MMKAKRYITRILFLIAFFAATVMAFPQLLQLEFAESFSANAVTMLDPWLRSYLNPASLAFALFAGWAANQDDKFTLIRWRLSWWILYLFISISFMGVSITNVSQFYWPHIVCTALVALGAYVMCWNYFETSWKRYFAIMGINLGAGWFVASFLFKIDTVARGEWAISLAAIAVAWVMINEQIRMIWKVKV